jgi:hypothetical protein
MRSFWDLVHYFSGKVQEETAMEEMQGQRIYYWSDSRSADGFDRNRRSKEYDEIQDNELDWGPGDQVGDKSEGWGWDVWKLWW